MTAGTLVAVCGKDAGSAYQPNTATLIRGDQIDRIDLWRMGRDDPARGRFWDAVLSTAPTPPLSEDALMG